MPFTSYLLYLLLLVLALPAMGQELLFRNLDVGLPSQESYNVMQDSKGYIWISTEAGLCRYSGNSLKIFNEKNGLPEQSCYVIKEDNHGLLWISTSAGRILNFSNDSIYEAAVSRNLRKYYHPNSNVQVYLIQFAGDSIYFHTPYSSYKACPSSGQVDSLPPGPASADYCFFFRNSMLMPWKWRKKEAIHKAKPNLQISIDVNGEKKQISLPYRKTYPPHWRVMTATNQNGTSVIVFNNVLIRLNSDLTYKVSYLPNMILSLYCDPDGGFWVGTYKKGVFYYPGIEHSGYCLKSLSGFSVTGICQDREEGIWCTTLEEGVFYSRSKEVVHYTNVDGLNKKAELLKAINGSIYAASSTGEILGMKGDKVANYKVRQYSYPPGDLLPRGPGWLVCAKDMLVQTDKEFRTVRNLNQQGTGLRIGGRQLLQTPDGRIFIAHGSSLYELLDSVVIERSNPGNYNVTCICPGSRNNELLVGTKTGLYRVDTRRFLWTRIININDHVMKILQGAAGEIWIITRHSGMLLMRGDSLTPIEQLMQLPTDRFFDVIEDRHHVLWIGCAKGLVRIERHNDKPRMQIYNVTNGLAANEVYNLAADSDYLYLSTVKGISYFPLRADLSNNTAPQVFIRSVFIGDRQIKHKMKEPLLLSWRDNPIKIKVDGLCFKQGESPELQYILKGQDEVLHSQGGNEIVLGRLSPGSYKLQVFARNSDGKRSTQPAVMQFRVRPPAWQTWWFITCVTLTGVIVIYLLVSRKIKQVQKKEQEMSRINHLIAEYRLTALQAQMNPHFIFNAINSIQTYILDNQPQVAYDYLAKFSKLIRLVLYHAKDRTLPLEQELDMLRTYTELEQLRFNNKFDVMLHVDTQLDPHRTELPPMLLQPYVENAIWHGLLPLKNTRRGLLKISITKNEEGLKILIEDNGVGRQYQKKDILPGHRSLGMILNKQRMELLGHMPEYQGATISITDLYDLSGAPAGTKVMIHLLLMAEVKS